MSWWHILGAFLMFALFAAGYWLGFDDGKDSAINEYEGTT